MIRRDTEFFRLSQEVAEEFLQSTVIVDDFAGMRERRQDIENKKLVEPEIRRRPQSKSQGEKIENEIEQLEDKFSQPENHDVAHYLNAKKVIDGFAKKKIVCSVLQPRKDEMESITNILQNLADCADIIVLDWSLYSDNGEKALDILTHIIQPELNRLPSGLRLISIYTGAPDIANIANHVKQHLESELEININEEAESLTLTTNSTRIVILAKPEARNIPKEYENCIVPYKELAKRLTEEFTIMTAGLVSNVVLDALSKVRKNTHRVLSRFSDDLDAPYLSHRFMLSNPSDSEQHITALVAEEFQAILEEANVGQKAGIEAIDEWITANEITGFNLEGFHDFSIENILTILESGFQQFDDISKNKRKKLDKDIHKRDLTQYFMPSDDNQYTLLDERFSHLTIMRAHYHQAIPKLTLGTIIKGDTYYVCILPRCDCVRVYDKRNFPFLPLSKNEHIFDTILLENELYIRLLSNQRPYGLVLIPFESNEENNGIVTAYEDNGSYFFEDANGEEYKWLGELRNDHALRLSNRFSAKLSRVGLDESEWLRRSSRR